MDQFQYKLMEQMLIDDVDLTYKQETIFATHLLAQFAGKQNYKITPIMTTFRKKIGESSNVALPVSQFIRWYNIAEDMGLHG